MRFCLSLVCALVLAGNALGVSFVDLLGTNNDDVMLRKKSTQVQKAVPKKVEEVVDTKQVETIYQTNVVTDVVTQTNVVREVQTDYVVQTNVVTDVVTQTNVVREVQTDYVVKTNVVTDVVTQTNVVREVQTDYVVKTNVVVEKRFDESEKQAMVARLAEAEAALRAAQERAAAAEKKAHEKITAAEKAAASEREARVQAEDQAGTMARQIISERKKRENAESLQRVAEARALAERKAAEKATEEARQSRAAVEQAQVEKLEEKPHAEAELVKGGKSVSTNGVASAKKKKLTGRAATIVAERTDYDRKEGVILFDRNVHVDDEQYQMHADRLFVFLDGTNELKRLVAIGHVAITNEDKTAYCARATYSKPTGKIVMYSNDTLKAKLTEGTKKSSTVVGEKIIFWVDSEQVEVENPIVTMPGGGGKGMSPKSLLGK